MRRFALWIAATWMGLAATGCSTTVVSLHYDRDQYSKPIVQAAPQQKDSVAVGTFVDQRGHDQDSKWLGAIRGGYGNPLKDLVADQPVSEVVASAFAEGLKARGLLAAPSAAPYVLSGAVKELVCNQVATQEATVRIEVSVTERASGGTVFSKLFSAEKKASPTTLFTNGVFGSVDDLRRLLADALAEAVDQALDDPQFRTAIGAGGSTS